MLDFQQRQVGKPGALPVNFITVFFVVENYCHYPTVFSFPELYVFFVDGKLLRALHQEQETNTQEEEEGENGRGESYY